MKRRIAVAAGGVVLVVGMAAGIGGGAFADAPNGNYVWNTNQNSQGNCVGVYSAQIIQNGQFVGGANGQAHVAPGNRAELVHEAQASSC